MALQDNIKSMPATYFIIGGLVLTILYYSSSFDDGSALQSNVDAKRQELTDLNKQISDNEAIAKDMPEYEKKLQYIGEQFQKAIAYLPSDQRNEDILRQFNLLASTTGINIISVKPDDETIEKAFYEEMLIDMEMKGTYAQLTNFLSLVSKIPRIINVRDLSLKVSDTNIEETPILTLSGKLVAFRFLENKAKEQAAKGDNNVVPTN